MELSLGPSDTNAGSAMRTATFFSLFNVRRAVCNPGAESYLSLSVAGESSARLSMVLRNARIR